MGYSPWGRKRVGPDLVTNTTSTIYINCLITHYYKKTWLSDHLILAVINKYSLKKKTDFLWCGPFFKVFIEFVTMLLLSTFWFFGPEASGILAPRLGVQPCIGKGRREVPSTSILKAKFWQSKFFFFRGGGTQFLNSLILKNIFCITSHKSQKTFVFVSKQIYVEISVLPKEVQEIR